MNNTVINIAEQFIESISLARSQNTARTYKNAMNAFCETLSNHKMPPDETEISNISEEAISWFANDLKYLSPSSEQLYLTAVAGFYQYLAAEGLADINLPRVRLLIRQRSRRPGKRLPQFPQSDIVEIVNYAINLASQPTNHPGEQLINLRDRAFILTLADTGLRVHEACNLRRGDVDWNEGRALIIGKGDQQAIVRFSSRSLSALRDYLSARGAIDGASSRPLASLPLFSRHDRGAGKKVKPITTTTGRNIITQRVIEALGPEAAGRITPHSFRHYFVTTVLRGSGGNLKLAQELARHHNISVTQRYAHLSDDELDRGYWKIFEDLPSKETG